MSSRTPKVLASTVKGARADTGVEIACAPSEKHHSAHKSDKQQGNDALDGHRTDCGALQVEQQHRRREQPEIDKPELDLRRVQNAEAAREQRTTGNDHENRNDECVYQHAAARENRSQHNRKTDQQSNNEPIDRENGQRRGERFDPRVIAMASGDKFVQRDTAILSEDTV